MNYRRIKTNKEIIVETDVNFLEIKNITLSTATSIKDLLETSAEKELADLFVHKNKDGTIAIATGKEPKVWPEDEIYPKLVIEDKNG